MISPSFLIHLKCFQTVLCWSSASSAAGSKCPLFYQCIFKRRDLPFTLVFLSHTVGGDGSKEGWCWTVEWSWKLWRLHIKLRQEPESSTGCLTNIQKVRGKNWAGKQKTGGREAAAWPCTSLSTCLQTLMSRTSFKLMKTSERSTKVGTCTNSGDDSRSMSMWLTTHEFCVACWNSFIYF